MTSMPANATFVVEPVDLRCLGRFGDKYRERRFVWCRARAVLPMLVFLMCIGPPLASASIIFVTTTADKVNGIGGCSLQEAIYAANFNNNIAPDALNDDASEHFVQTHCVAGSPNGIDVIVLPAGSLLLLDHPNLDIHNPFGPTATPPVNSRITILANGSRFEHAGQQSFRAFAVTSTGDLTIDTAHLLGFSATGGEGGTQRFEGEVTGGGGGGGLGAGGAIFVKGSGRLIVVASTFEGNGAIGGNGSKAGSSGLTGAGGGGGMGGAGRVAPFDFAGSSGGGAGGDASRDGAGGTIPIPPSVHLTNANFDAVFPLFCGGRFGGGPRGPAGEDGVCPGGGGGGGAHAEGDHLNGCVPIINVPAGKGGNGNYGGGGGGGGSCEDGSGAPGGDGGFGGGGGAAVGSCDAGGNGGFGGGGGVCRDHPGAGGTFGGNANATGGGGGGALGGAIFSDGGAVTVRNSTFTRNFAVRGLGGNAGKANAADNGADAGGAIYVLNGALTIQHSTISGNEGTGSLAGVAMTGTAFVLNNTIIANNGAQGCGIGTGSTASGVGNLIQANVDCPGVVSTADPQLAALSANGSDTTPTMAIAKTSPAIDAADPGTSLSFDQRGTERPQPLHGAFDIGAYERCPVVRFGPSFVERCESDISTTGSDLVALTIKASPAAGGIVNPLSGNQLRNSVVAVSATPVVGYTFTGWSGNVGDPNSLSTLVAMSQPQTVTANFTTSLFATMTGNITLKTGPTNARVWTLTLQDNGPAAATGISINSFALTPAGARVCTPVVVTSLPIALSALDVGQTAATNVTINFSSCPAAARFTAVFTYTANNGSVAGTVTRTNQFQ